VPQLLTTTATDQLIYQAASAESPQLLTTTAADQLIYLAASAEGARAARCHSNLSADSMSRSVPQMLASRTACNI